MTEKEFYEEVYEIISGESIISETAKVVYDKKQKQYSVKIPKRIADKLEMKPELFEMKFTLNLKTNQRGEIEKALETVLLKKDGGKEKTSS
ncbi:hypothetical protein HZC31_02000 [Candidatus Woesearchaeota archaeon]|nr:hypothetical protein [Candidatus Woesearchaeota archaeon]